MKKNVIPKIIFVILIIVLIIMIILTRINQKPKDLTLKMYKDICEKTNYTFSMVEENSDIDYSLIVSKQENFISIDATSDGEHTTTLVKDGYAYYIMHKKKEYYLYDSSEIDADILRNNLTEIENKKYVNGYEKINGKNYYYEEYEGISAFVIGANYIEDESSIKTRFYYDKENIVYIKTIIDDTYELLKIEFSNDIDNSLFEIPDDYAEM